MPNEYIKIGNDFNIDIDEASILLKSVKKNSNDLYFAIEEDFLVIENDENLNIAFRSDCSDDRVNQIDKIRNQNFSSSFDMSFKDLKSVLKKGDYDYFKLIPYQDKVKIQNTNESLSVTKESIDFDFIIDNAKNTNNDKALYLDKNILELLPNSDEVTILYDEKSYFVSLIQNIDDFTVKTFFMMPQNKDKDFIESEKKPIQIPKNATPVVEKNVLKESNKPKEIKKNNSEMKNAQPYIDKAIELKLNSEDEFNFNLNFDNFILLSLSGNRNKDLRKKIMTELLGRNPKSNEYGISNIKTEILKIVEQNDKNTQKAVPKAKAIAIAKAKAKALQLEAEARLRLK